MSDKVPYSEIMQRMHSDINYIAEEAYQRGINDGSLDVKQRVEEAYQRGFDDGKDSVMLPCDGCKWDTEEGEGAHCKRCSRNCLDNYEEKQKADREKRVDAEVGDDRTREDEKMKVVVVFSSGFHLVVTCDEFETTRDGLGSINQCKFIGITDNKPLFLNPDHIDCIYRVLEDKNGRNHNTR